MVYLVDDNADYRFVVQQVFNLFLPQYAVRFFADGQQLMAHIAQADELLSVSANQTQPDLIVLDMDMPLLTGLQTLERLTQYPHWRPIPVVLMSSRTDPQLRDQAYRLGAHAYLNKPVDLFELKETMAQLCHQWLDR